MRGLWYGTNFGMGTIALRPYSMSDARVGVKFSITWDAATKPSINRRAMAIFHLGGRWSRHEPCVIELDRDATTGTAETGLTQRQFSLLHWTTVCFFDEDDKECDRLEEKICSWKQPQKSRRTRRSRGKRSATRSGSEVPTT